MSTLLDRLDRLEREATTRTGNATLDAYVQVPRNHLRALIEAARALDQLTLSIRVRSEVLPAAVRAEAELGREALAPLLAEEPDA